MGPAMVPSGNSVAPAPASCCIPQGNFESRFQELTTACTPGRDGGVVAVSWILHHDKWPLRPFRREHVLLQSDQQFEPHARGIAQRSRPARSPGICCDRFDARLIEGREDSPVIEKKLTSGSAGTKLKTRLGAGLDYLERLLSRSGVSEIRRAQYQAQIKHLRERPLKLNAAGTAKRSL